MDKISNLSNSRSSHHDFISEQKIKDLILRVTTEITMRMFNNGFTQTQKVVFLKLFTYENQGIHQPSDFSQLKITNRK